MLYEVITNPDIPDNFWFLDGPDSNYEEGISTLFNGDIKKAIGQYYSQIQSMINDVITSYSIHYTKLYEIN